jgi:hypothetical protein
MTGRGSKIAMAALALPTLLCVVFAGLNVANEVWDQWATPFGWVPIWSGSVHSSFFLVLVAVASLQILLLVVVGIWCLFHFRRRSTLRRILVGWFVVLTASALSYFPSDQQYAAIAVFLLGPGPNSVRLQRNAATWDSALLLNALIMRGAQLEATLLCDAAAHDSSNVVARLIANGAPVNEQHYPSRITALHNAVERRQYRVAEILRGAGARADIPNLKGQTPLDLAVAQRDDRMVRILMD